MSGNSEKIKKLVSEKSSELLSCLVKRRLENYPQEFFKYGVDHHNLEKYSLYDVNVFRDALAAADPEILKDYVAWLQSMMTNKTVPRIYLAKNLDILEGVFVDFLPEEFHPLIHDMMLPAKNLAAGYPSASVSYIHPKAPLGEAAQKYFEYVRGNDKAGATAFIEKILKEGTTSIKDIYIYIFQPVQYEIGRLWETDVITAADEHVATTITQFILSKFYDYIFSTEKNGLKMAAAGVNGEHHDMGIRMVTDLFELDGWDTNYLGANCGIACILDELKKSPPDLLALSAAIQPHVRWVEELISQVRKEHDKRIKILVGGYVFNKFKDLWKHVGADIFAQNGAAAVLECRRLFGLEDRN